MSFLTMKNAVAKRCRVAPSGWNTETIGTYLNECVAELAQSAIDWKVLEKQDTTSTVAGQANYALPTDWERTLAVNIETGSTYIRLVENSYNTIRSILNKQAGANSQPIAYCTHYQQTWLAPEPDQVYTFRLDFITKPADMATDGATTPFPEKLLMQYAMAYFKKDLGRSAEFDREYQLYQIELQKFTDAQDRGPDRFDGMNTSFDAVSPYYSGYGKGYAKNYGDLS